jgi:radical SAM superfamily enzyme YgiQ (UPF0313 family)
MPVKVTLVYTGIGICGFNANNADDRERHHIGHGIASVGASARAAGYNVNLIDLRTFSGWEEFQARILHDPADVYGISISQADCKPGAELIKRIKLCLPDSKIIVGGVHPSVFPFAYSDLPVDTVVVGEGEVSFVDLLVMVESHIPLPKMIRGARPDLDSIPWIDRELFDYGKELECLFSNDQPGPTVTILAGRGCPMLCTYCVDGDTLVMMEDFSHKKIKNVSVGDSIIGLRKKKKGYEVTTTTITNHFNRESETYLIETDRGDIKATGEHPFLSNNGRWRLVKNLKIGDSIRYVCSPNQTAKGEDYKKGYVAGVVEGDGYTGKYTRKRNRDEVYYNVRVAGDYEMLDVFEEYCKDIGINVHHHKFNGGKIFYNLNRAVGGYSKKTYEEITDLLSDKLRSKDFKIGFLAGMMDADGANNGNTIRYCGINKRLMNKVESYMNEFGFKVVHEPKGIRLLGNSSIRNSFISLIRPNVPSKKRMILGNAKATILRITKLKIQKVYNISTGTENFVANGLASHNCQPAENTVFGKPYRLRSPENVIAELRYLHNKYHFKNIIFWDDTFTINKKWVMRFCDLYEAENFGATISANSRADIICNNEEMIARLASIGLNWFIVGLESGSQRLLDFIKKGTTVEQNKQAVDLCRKYGISTYATIMYGLPTETKEESLATYNMVQDINPAYTMVFWFIPIPGTEIYKYCVDNDLILEGVSERTIARTATHKPTLKNIDYDYIYYSLMAPRMAA